MRRRREGQGGRTRGMPTGLRSVRRRNCPGFFEHDAVWLEQGVNVAGSAARVVGQGHRGAAEDVDVGHHAAFSQSVTKPTEGFLDALSIEEWGGFAHAASIS